MYILHICINIYIYIERERYIYIYVLVHGLHAPGAGDPGRPLYMYNYN